jgi:hypothetical protein
VIVNIFPLGYIDTAFENHLSFEIVMILFTLSIGLGYAYLSFPFIEFVVVATTLENLKI